MTALSRTTLALVVVLVLASGVWLASRDPVERERAQPGPEAGPRVGTVPVPELERGVPAVDAAAEPERRAATAEEEPAPPRFELHRTRTLEGVVRFPEGTPEDERVAVVLEFLPKPEGDDPPWSPWWGTYEEAARVELGADRGFALPLPVAEGALRLDLDADHLYLQWPLRVEDPGSEELVELDARLGSCVTFVLRPPVGGVHDPRDLVGRTVTMSHLPRGVAGFSGSPPQVSFVVGEDLTLMGRGLGVDRSYDVERPSTGAGGLVPFVVAGDWDPVLTAGANERIEIPLLDGIVLSGTVVDEAGGQLGGVQVKAACRYGRTTSNYYEETDSEGRFTFPGLHPGLSAVSARRSGWLESRLESSNLGSGTRREDLQLVLTRGLALRGHVHLADGRPVASVEVEVREAPGDRRSKRFKGETDAAGRFEVSGLGAGEYVVRVEARIEPADGAPARPAPRGSDAPLQRAERDGVPAGGPDIALVLDESPRLAGRVVDDRGVALESFSLEAAQAGSGRRSRLREHDRHFQSEDGGFVWDELPPGRWTVTASARGHAESEAVTLELPGAAPTELVCARGGRVGGVVVDSAGRPVEDAWVSSSWVAPNLTRGGPSARTGPEGRFELEGVLAGRSLLSASTDDLRTPKPVEVVLAAGQEQDGVEIVLVATGRVLCEVRRADGRAAPGTTVTAVRPDGGPGGRGATDGAGRAELGPFAPGEVTLSSYVTDEETGDWDTVTGTVTVVAGETVRLVLGGAAASAVVTVRGRVTCAGAGLAECYVSVQQGGERTSARTDADGRFELGLARGGQILLQLVPSGAGSGRTFDEVLPESGVHRVEYDLPGAGLRGRLLLGGGEDLFGVRVVARRRTEGGRPWERRPTSAAARVASDGSFAILHVEPGIYDLVVGSALPAGFRDGPSPSAVLRGVVVAPGEVVEGLELSPLPTGTISGTVVGIDGAAVEGAFVVARLSDGTPTASSAVTDHQGAFTLTGLPASEVLVSAACADAVAAAPTRATVTADGETEVELHLVAGTVLRCVLADEALDPTQLSIRVLDALGDDRAVDLRPSTGPHDASGSAREFGPLPSGSYRVEVRAGGAVVFERTGELAGQALEVLRIEG